jgi:hypothetical protein
VNPLLAVLHFQDELAVVNGLAYVVSPALLAVPHDVFDYVTSEEANIVFMNELGGLDG